MATQILQRDAIVVTRGIEWAQVLVGFEQANKYTLRDASGDVLGFMTEQSDFTKTLMRNVTTNHRSFVAHIFDPEGDLLFRLRRPFYWISSHIFAETPTGDSIGSVKMDWQLTSRKYDMFLHDAESQGQVHAQFAKIVAPMLGWDFHIQDAQGQHMASINRNFLGFGKEIFTDAGSYAIHMHQMDFTLEQRALLLAAAVSIDFDYFSRHSGMGFLPFPIPYMGGGGVEDVGGGVGGGVGEVGGGIGGGVGGVPPLDDLTSTSSETVENIDGGGFFETVKDFISDISDS